MPNLYTESLFHNTTHIKVEKNLIYDKNNENNPSFISTKSANREDLNEETSYLNYFGGTIFLNLKCLCRILCHHRCWWQTCRNGNNISACHHLLTWLLLHHQRFNLPLEAIVPLSSKLFPHSLAR